MTKLYTVSLSRHVAGMTKGPVAEASGAPDSAAVRECLPAQYRKSWDRLKGAAPKRTERADGPVYWTLHDRKGHYLNTVYAQA